MNFLCSYDGRMLVINKGFNFPVEHAGDKCTRKDQNCMQIMPQHVNGIDFYASSTNEMDLKKIIPDKDVDVTGIQGPNICWNKMQSKK